ncbi:MAG: ribose-phosphate diphosphokinase [Halopseudomonas sp.]
MASSPLLFNLHSDAELAQLLSQQLNAEPGQLSSRQFPDRETYLRVDSDCRGRSVVIFCNMFDPDPKIMPLLFLAETLRDLGADRIALVSPYLCYMRQDKRFQPGECVNVIPFSKLISNYFDYLVTLDPHLHRIDSLDQVYRIPSCVVQAAPLIASWLQQLAEPCVLIGPDSESEQWVSEVARLANAPFVILQKNRHGDRDVEVSIPQIDRWQGHRPVLIDDIIASGKTMLSTLQHLSQPRYQALGRPLCIGVHGIFADNAYAELTAEAEVISCNSIPHPSNRIEIGSALAAPLQLWLQG